LKNAAERPSTLIKVFAASGLLMTLLYIALSVVPIINVDDRALFAVKIGGLIIITNLIGGAIYFVSTGKRFR
jgi:hypothetical protein